MNKNAMKDATSSYYCLDGIRILQHRSYHTAESERWCSFGMNQYEHNIIYFNVIVKQNVSEIMSKDVLATFCARDNM